MGLLDGVRDVLDGVEAAIAGTGGGKLAMAFAKFYPGGLAAFLDRLREAGHGAAVESWLGGGQIQTVPAAVIAGCLPSAVAERLGYDLGVPEARVPTALAEFLPAAVAAQSEGGRLKPQPSFSTQVR